MNAPLRLIQREPDATLGPLLRRLAKLNAEMASVRAQIDIERQRLARKRGVAFIRFEAVKREFGAR